MVSDQAIRSFIMSSGERFCLLVDAKTRLPLFYPNLFVTTQIRNASLSVSAMESALGAINVLLRFCRKRKIDLHTRVLSGAMLSIPEIDGLRDECRRRVRGAAAPDVIEVRKRKSAGVARKAVGTAYEYARLTHVAAYLGWLAGALLGRRMDANRANSLKAVVTAIKARRPIKKRRNDMSENRALSDDEVAALDEAIQGEKPVFKNPGVLSRNNLIVQLGIGLGVRGGELLGIRIQDIDWQKNQLVVMRRHDQKDDPRLKQPKAKTLDRRIPLRDTLVKLLHEYVIKHRRLIPGARGHDYLLVVHKSGPTQGRPLSIAGLQKVIKVMSKSSPRLSELHFHLFRHTWNDRFSNEMDRGPVTVSEEEQEKVRSMAMGWRQGSGSAATYNRRFTEKKAHEIQLRLQRGCLARKEKGEG